MKLFNCDYNEGAHPAVMALMNETNMQQYVGYGEDEICAEARKLIKKACAREDVDVHFVVGGTQANLMVISHALRPHEGVLSASSGHINVHETGAVEATGHKILAVDGGADGKINWRQVEEACKRHAEDEAFEHIVKPKMVYISFPTENGALYSKQELADLRRVCDKWGLVLFADGARLGYGLTARGNDVTLSDMCDFCDAFYIGGTKVGALMGEAVVIINDELKGDFRYIIKQKGGMLAKGRLLGIQFKALFTDNLYFDIARRANELAYKIADACKEMGLKLLAESPTNQQFPIMRNDVIAKLGEKYVYSTWAIVDEKHTCVRFCTSWATEEADVEELIADIRRVNTSEPADFKELMLDVKE